MTDKELAWLGDAVLGLFAREWILAEESLTADERNVAYQAMTNNDFLLSFGKPTSVEAKIGEIYREAGLEAAKKHIQTELLPVFQKQWANRRKH